MIRAITSLAMTTTVGLLTLPSLALANQQAGEPTAPVLARCDNAAANAAAAAALAASIRNAVAKLPAARSSAEDTEAAILFTISQQEHCAGVVRATLASLKGGSDAFRLAVSRVRNSTLASSGTVGTAGLRSPNGAGTGSSGPNFFSAPIVGTGGGSTNYSQQ